MSGGPRGQEGVDSPSRELSSRCPGIHAGATLTTERTATVPGLAGILTVMFNMKLIAAPGAALNERTIPVGRPVQTFHTLTEVIARDGMDRVRPYASEIDPPPRVIGAPKIFGPGERYRHTSRAPPLSASSSAASLSFAKTPSGGQVVDLPIPSGVPPEFMANS